MSNETVVYQSRMRMNEEGYEFDPWENCTEGSYNDRTTAPKEGQWIYETRQLVVKQPVELLNFSHVNENTCYWAYLMLESDKIAAITESADFHPDRLEVHINVNGVTVTAQSFDSLMGYFVESCLKSKMEKLGLHSVEAAAKIQAEKFINRLHSDFEDTAYKLNDQLRHLTDMASSIVQAHWDEPFTVKERTNLLTKAVIRNDGKEKHQSWEANLDISTFANGDSAISGHGSLDLIGYGATEAEARADLSCVLTSLFR